MDIMEAMRLRHSVRQYLDKPIEEEKLRRLRREGDLHIQLVCEEPRAFGGMIARYGRFSGVHNYIALAGRREQGLSERAGYYGERLVLLAQSLGLNTCWVALTFSKGKCAAQLERGPQKPPPGKAVPGGPPHAHLVSERPQRGSAGADGHQPAEIPLYPRR